MGDEEVKETDVLVVGSGPIGATFARTLAAAGKKVIVVDAGPQHSARPGEHLKNAFVYQRDLDRFTPIVQGLLNPVSLASAKGGRTVIDPLSYRPPSGSIRSAHNPRQAADKNRDFFTLVGHEGSFDRAPVMGQFLKGRRCRFHRNS